MQKIRQLKIILFCAMVYGSAMVSLLYPDQETSVTENRELAQRPDLHIREFLHGTYQEQYETYLDDQFVGRDKWVSLASLVQAGIGKKEINGVYLGRDHYLLEKWQKSDFDWEQVEENIEILSEFLNGAAEMYGSEHVSCMMIPSKTTVLSEYLPEYVDALDQTPVLHALREKVSDPEKVIDLQEALQQHSKEYIYYHTDHHWTTLGAYYAYQAWAVKTGQAGICPLEHYQRDTIFKDFYGTTYNKIHIGGLPDQVELFHNGQDEMVQVSMDKGDLVSDSMYFLEEAEQGFNRYNIFFSKNTFQIEVNTQAKTGKTLLLIKDSFANCFVPFLTGDYDRIVMIDYRYGKIPIGSVMDQYEDITDVLVLFNTEKFMQNNRLGKLADLCRENTEEKGMEEFHMEDFVYYNLDSALKE